MNGNDRNGGVTVGKIFKNKLTIAIGNAIVNAQIFGS